MKIGSTITAPSSKRKINMRELFLSLSFPLQALFVYGITINVLTFFYFGIDKLQARGGRRRVSEKSLWILSLVGGSIGGLLGMHYFRHKTKKISFQFVLALIVLVQLSILYILFLPLRENYDLIPP